MARLLYIAAAIAPIVATVSVSAQNQLSGPGGADEAGILLGQLAKADSNGDGAVSRDELLLYRADQWRRIDRNGDGFFSRDDLPVFAAGRWDGERIAAMRARFDGDRDGRISRSELVDGPTLLFDMADRDDDAIVTRTELQALRDRHGR